MKPLHARLPLLLSGLILLTGCTDMVRRAGELPAFRTDVDRMEVEQVAMRDGARLTTRIYYPAGQGPWPVILMRNPYNMWNNFDMLNRILVRYGYVVVHQDVRGRFKSEGEWLPLLHERSDGLDMLAWLREQPWQNGNIGLFGASYLSAVHWAVADQLPPEVKTIVPAIIGTDLRNVLYEKGMFRHEIFTFWAALMPDHRLAIFNANAYRKAIAHYPPIEIDERFFGGPLPWLRQWQMAAPATAPLWQLPEARLLGQAPKLATVPMLMLTGWYDLFLASQIEDFRNLATRADSRLIVGPWTHILGLIGDGEKPFPESSVGPEFAKVIQWFDHHLKGEALDDWGPVRSYEIGHGWRERTDWPPKTRNLRLVFDHIPAAYGCNGGVLRPGKVSGEGRLDYVYDPRNPVPTRGGGPMLGFVMPGWTDALPSNRNQRGLCERQDVLTFRTPPLEKPLRIAGPPVVTLTVSSDAADTAFTAKLIETPTRGPELNVRDSITSLAYRNDATLPVAYEPGTPVTVTIDMWPIEWRFEPGTRLRIDLSSSNHPAYHAHANRAGPWALQAAPVPARQTLWFGRAVSAWVDLPVVIDDD